MAGAQQIILSYGGVPSASAGQQAYTAPGTYSWTAPAGVTSVCVVCIGGGQAGGAWIAGTSQGGDGGSLAYGNNIPVTPGQSYTVVVGAGGNGFLQAGGSSSFINTATLVGGGGGTGLGSAGSTRSGGGSGGAAGPAGPGGGGGAGGYSGNGGAGGGFKTAGLSGAGGGGGGGAGGDTGTSSSNTLGGSGGGVGIMGQGLSGAGGSSGSQAGFPGSGGMGATYGGGGGGYDSHQMYYPPGARGAVRIIWGPGRAFPSTGTQDV